MDDEAALAALVGVPPAAGTDLRSERISAAVSAVSRHPQVRERMRALQRSLAGDAAVLEGRDTGTQVRPDAAVKIYLTAAGGGSGRAAGASTWVCRSKMWRARSPSAIAATRPRCRRRRDAHVLDTGQLDADQVTARCWRSCGQVAA